MYLSNVVAEPLLASLFQAVGQRLDDVEVNRGAGETGALALASDRGIWLSDAALSAPPTALAQILAHELKHVQQARHGRVRGHGVVFDPGLELEADQAATRMPAVSHPFLASPLTATPLPDSPTLPLYIWAGSYAVWYPDNYPVPFGAWSAFSSYLGEVVYFPPGDRNLSAWIQGGNPIYYTGPSHSFMPPPPRYVPTMVPVITPQAPVLTSQLTLPTPLNTPNPTPQPSTNQSSALTVTVPTTVPVSTDLAAKTLEEIITDRLSVQDLLLMRLVCKHWNHFATELISLVCPFVYPASSLAANNDISVGMAMKSIVSQTTRRLAISFDKITDTSLLKPFMSSGKELLAQYGTTFVPKGLTNGNGVQTEGINFPGGKLHAKLMTSDSHTAMVGTPNWSVPALNDQGMEVILVFHNKSVAELVSQYQNVIRNPTESSVDLVKSQIKGFNESKSGIRAAFAPYNDIPTFIAAELEHSQKVIVRLYLMSLNDAGANFIDTIANLVKGGAEVDMYLDEPSYNKKVKIDDDHFDDGYVKKAVDALFLRLRGHTNAAKLRIFTQTVPGTGRHDGIMHDKLFLVKTKTGKKVLLGSSGMTLSVMQNLNGEDFWAVDSAKIYDYFKQKHHKVSLDRFGATQRF